MFIFGLLVALVGVFLMCLAVFGFGVKCLGFSGKVIFNVIEAILKFILPGIAVIIIAAILVVGFIFLIIVLI